MLFAVHLQMSLNFLMLILSELFYCFRYSKKLKPICTSLITYTFKDDDLFKETKHY